jgi:genome maintenance exonuclease 1
MTLLQPKYVYEKIDRNSVEGRRLYALPDGSKVPSVTTILDKTKPQDKIDALNRWKKSVGEKKAQEIVTEAAGRGTRMHKFLEDYITTGIFNDPGTNPYSKQSHAMARHVIDNGLVNVSEVWGVEVPLYYPGLYAGTTDCVGIHSNDPAIMDHKQSNKPKKAEWIEDYYLQMVAYALAHNKVHGTNIQKGVVFMCVSPKLDENLVMIETPKYQEFILKPSEFSYWEQRWWDRVEQYYSKN